MDGLMNDRKSNVLESYRFLSILINGLAQLTNTHFIGCVTLHSVTIGGPHWNHFISFSLLIKEMSATIQSFCDNYRLIARKLDLYAFSNNNYIKRKSSANIHFISWRRGKVFRPSKNLKQKFNLMRDNQSDRRRRNEATENKPHFESVY